MQENNPSSEKTMQYQTKYVAFIDVIGWEEETNKEPISESIKEYFDYVKSQDTSLEESRACDNNAGNLDRNNYPEFCFCSDSMFVSSIYPAQIVLVRNLVRKLLSLGFLCRGAIVKDRCYHKDNVIFGPAINKAVRMEQKGKCQKGEDGKCQEGKYVDRMPAIVIHDSAVDLKDFRDYRSPDTVYTSEDKDGRLVLNVVTPNILNTEIQDNIGGIKRILFYDGIKKHLEAKQDHPKEDCRKKWQYAKRLFDQKWQENVAQFIKSEEIKDK